MTGPQARGEASSRGGLWGRAKLELAVWFALIVLLALTLVLAFVPLHGANMVASLLIAGAKMLLVGFYFMHLRGASGLLRLAAIAGPCFLLLMLVLTFADVLTR